MLSFLNSNVVPADKTSNIMFVLYGCLIADLDLHDEFGDCTYKRTTFNKDESKKYFMASLNIPMETKSIDLSYLYWICKLHKTPYKTRCTVGSSICSTLYFLSILQQQKMTK